jgi:hypothetical protein
VNDALLLGLSRCVYGSLELHALQQPLIRTSAVSEGGYINPHRHFHGVWLPQWLEERLEVFEKAKNLYCSAVLFAHVHFGQPGVNGGILFFLCSGGSQDPCPPSGTISGTTPAADVMAIPEQGIQAGVDN